ncbi:MAG: FtsH protease activity modulator HflK [Deltaproteobacteria bacterium]|nr:FtsH protease activity modulator HflK [Deltaproteobacteria bacterium]
MPGYHGGGYGGGEEPPIDLEELRNKFKKYSNKIKLPGPAIIALLLVGFWILSGLYTVAPDQQAVIRRFGAFIEPLQGPGLHWRFPWPIESATKVNVRKIYSIEVGFRTVDPGPPARYRDVPSESLMLTGDENIVSVDFIVQYMIADPAKYLFEIGSPITTLKEVAESVMREISGKHRIDDVLTEKKTEIQTEVFAMMQSVLNEWKTGIKLQALKLQDVMPPSMVDAAFKDVASAREDKDRIIKQADGYRNDIMPKAKGEAAKMINQAEAYSQSKVKRAQGEADRFNKTYRAYALARDITRRRMFIETMESVLKSADKIIMGSKAMRNVLPHLPLKSFGSFGKAGK